MRLKLFPWSSSSFGVFCCRSLLSSSGIQFFSARPSSVFISSPLFSSSSSSLLLKSSQHFKSSTRLFCKDHFDLDQCNLDVVYEDLTVDKYNSLIKSESDRQLITEILKTYEYTKFETGDVPSTITLKQMNELMNLPKYNWKRTLSFLTNKENLKNTRKWVKSQRPKKKTYNDLQMIKDAGLEPDLGVLFDPKTGAPIYGEWLNSHFIKLRMFEYRCSFVPKLLSSYQFGQRLIIDCDYDYSIIEAKGFAHEIQKAFAVNRRANEPFNFILTGLKSPVLRAQLEEYSVSFTSNQGYLGINTYSESFEQLFPESKFIYLSPHAKQVLERFDDDAVYILGGLSAKTYKSLSYAKSIETGVPAYSFPTSSLIFKAMRGAKCLSICESTKIMLLAKETNNIEKAVSEGIDINRLKNEKTIQEEQLIRLNKLLKTTKRTKLKPDQKRID